MSSFTHPRVTPKLFDFLSSIESYFMNIKQTNKLNKHSFVLHFQFWMNYCITLIYSVNIVCLFIYTFFKASVCD